MKHLFVFSCLFFLTQCDSVLDPSKHVLSNQDEGKIIARERLSGQRTKTIWERRLNGVTPELETSIQTKITN